MTVEDRLFRTADLRDVTGIVARGIDKSTPDLGASNSCSSLVKPTAPLLFGALLWLGGIPWPAAARLDRPDGDGRDGEGRPLRGGKDGEEKSWAKEAIKASSPAGERAQA